MADQISIQHSAAAANIYAIIRDADGAVWNGSSFEAYLTANLGNYDVALTEQGTASRYYTAAMPSVSAGRYSITAFVRAGGSPAETDTCIGDADAEWDGTRFTRLGAPAGTSIAADLLTIDNLVDDLEGRLTSTRAGYLDNLSAGAVATAAALATVDGIVDDILLDTAEIGAAGAGLTNINLPNQTMDIVGNITGNLSGSVGSVTGAVGSVTGNVGGNVTGSVGSLATQAKADVNAEADAALVDIHLDHLLAATYDPASKPGAADALLNELVESDGGVARYTANALEQAPTGGSAPTASEIADAVWDEDLTGHTTTDSAGDILGNVATGTPPTAAAIADAVWDEATSGHTTSGTFGEQLKTDVDAILVDTAEIGAAGAGLTEAGGTGDHLSAVPWNAAWDAEVQSEATDALNAYDPPTKAELDSAVSPLALQTSVDTLEASAAAIEADTQDIQSRLPAALVGGRIDATVDATGMESGAIDAILDDTIGDGTLTVRQVLRVLVAGMAGKLSGAATTTITIRNAADSADVIVATVDADGNRSAVTVTP